MNGTDTKYDCLIIGAGPGGLQAALHLARYNRRVLVFDRPGGRTRHASRIVNYLGIPEISGRDLIETCLRQVRSFGVEIKRETVDRLGKNGGGFLLSSNAGLYRGRYVIASAGARDTLPRLKNLGRFFGRSFFTCVDCDGHHTTGRKLLVMGNSLNAGRLALGMKQMYTQDITLLLVDYSLPPDYEEAVNDEGIGIINGTPVELHGNNELSAVELSDGTILACEAIMATFGWELNDSFLTGLDLQRDGNAFKIMTDAVGESSLPGLYIVGAMRPGHSQAIIAAGQGAAAAIDINQRLLEI